MPYDASILVSLYRFRALPVFLAMLVLVLAARSLAAEVLELPFEQPLGEGDAFQEIGIDLHRATVELVVDPAASPRVRARRLHDDAETTAGGEAPPAIELIERAGSISVARAAARGGAAVPIRVEPAVPIRVELVVVAAQRIELAGSELHVVIRDARPAPPAEDELRHLELRVERSNVDLEGVHGARLTVAGGRLHLRGTGGEVAVRVAGGAEVEIDRHAGGLQLTGGDGEVRIAGHVGELALELEKSRLVVSDGESHCYGHLRGGWTQLSGWRGKGRLTGSGAIVEVLLAGSPESELNLEGRGLDARVDRYEGAFVARLGGGTLRGANLVGPVDVSGHSEAVVELAEIHGEVRLSLEGGASAQVSDVPETLVAELTDSRLESERIGDLQILAQRSEVAAAGLRRLGRAKAGDSRLELDLTRITHDPALILQGASRARLRLPLPCEVRLVQVGELGEEQADVSGCVLRTRSEVTERFAAQTLVEDAVKLVASVPKESSLVVTGVALP